MDICQRETNTYVVVTALTAPVIIILMTIWTDRIQPSELSSSTIVQFYNECKRRTFPASHTIENSCSPVPAPAQ